MASTLTPRPHRRVRLPRPARAATPETAPSAIVEDGGPRGSVIATEMLLLLMAVIWGVNFIVVKLGAALVGPLAFNSVRLAIAAALLLAFTKLTVRVPWPSRRETVALLGIGALGNGVYQVLFIEGLSRTQPGTASLMLASSPALIALVGRVFGVERVSRRGLLGIGASVAGVGLVMLGSTGAGGASTAGALAGNALCLAGAVCWAFFVVLLKPYTERLNSWQVLSTTMIGGAIPLLALGAPQIAAVHWTALPATAYAALAYSCLLAMVVAYAIYYRGVRVIGPTRTSMFSNVQPFVALLAAWAFHYGMPTPVQLAGAVGIMAGVLLTRS